MNSSDPYRIPGLELIDHAFEAPLDYLDPRGRQIDLFVREVRDLDPKSSEKPFRRHHANLCFQGVGQKK